ncbi:MAG: F0F1 ATP synthase subunit epsilon [Candidatus Solibacter usitatus]|nr:F0F1 ATP synthase subunit epsilon [Candidatus Solibacter usitatus]
MSTFELEIATPERLLVKESATEAQIPGASGELGVLPGHAMLLSSLGAGVLTYKAGGTNHSLAVSGGVVEIQQDVVRVLAMVAEKPSEIDAKRAREAEKRASDRLATIKDNIDSARAFNALKRAQARLAIASPDQQH